jgi:hypothetical protein
MHFNVLHPPDTFKCVWGFPDVPKSPSQRLCKEIPLAAGLMKNEFPPLSPAG